MFGWHFLLVLLQLSENQCSEPLLPVEALLTEGQIHEHHLTRLDFSEVIWTRCGYCPYFLSWQEVPEDTSPFEVQGLMIHALPVLHGADYVPEPFKGKVVLFVWV